ncbi:MAG: tRNA (pseudouridine(54)-N(1))-methyltransferase TrmY [Candidatus Diapherotrites archaeon]|nr:tRNA (pseudouridine(54)-N(1))-methyltransferase TrmY [Candidatus Diapherotrites archaeon]
MKTFLIAANNAFTGKKLNEKDLPGMGGRIDVVCRCVSSALWLSGSLRNDTKFTAVLGGQPNPPMTLFFKPEKLQRISPDERSIAFAMKKALALANETLEIKKTNNNNPTINVETPQGIELQNIDLEEELNKIDLLKEKTIFFLDPNGTDLEKIDRKDLEKDTFWVLGDNNGFTKKQKELLKKINAKPISLGEKEYLSSQCITFVNMKLDRMEL